jgi:hypothetical protein
MKKYIFLIIASFTKHKVLLYMSISSTISSHIKIGRLLQGKYEVNCIINVDQTNVDSNETSSTTLSNAGTRSVDGKMCGHSGKVA